MEITQNDLKEKYFVANGYEEYKGIQKIEQVQIVLRTKLDDYSREVIVWIRSNDTCWLRADSCFIDSLSECQEYLYWFLAKESERKLAKLLEPQTLIA